MDNMFLIAAAFVSGAMLVWPMVRRGSGGVSVTTLEATQLINRQDALVVDVREQAEYAQAHILNSRLLPLSQIEARMADVAARRRAALPAEPSAGSFFRNPPGENAGKLLEACGLKGYTVGGAQVSPKHANFVVNLGGATASDIDAVIRHAQAEVHRQFGLTLEREVQYAGVWT